MQNKKLTVLYICSDYTMGGSTASLLALIRSLKDEIYPIVIFPSTGVGYDCFVKNGIECYVYPFIKLYEFYPNKLKDVWKHPWRWHYIKKLRFDIGCCAFVGKMLKGRDIDIVHSNISAVDVGIKLAKHLKAKHVWHIRECMDLHGGYEVYGGYDKLIAKIKKADAIISISHFVQEHYCLPKSKSFVINNAVRSVKDAIYEPIKDKYILFSSYNLTKAKGTGWAINAFEKSGLAEHGYILKLMGNVPESYKNELDNILNGCKCKTSIELVPCQQDVKPYFAKAAAFIMASDCEGLGRVTAEAMFFGCPVLARATGGTLDMVKDKETGYLFTTIDECAELLKVVSTTNQTELIKRAQQFACDNLSIEVYGSKIKNVYKFVLNNDYPPPRFRHNSQLQLRTVFRQTVADGI